MNRLLACVVLAVVALACGKPPAVEPDAGVDTSCGIDCAAQQKYGLIVGRCFEYTDTKLAQDLPALGVQVGKVTELEGGLKVIPVDYLQSGSHKMTDSFAIVDGALVLARRNWPLTADSVNYKDQSGRIVGVTWWQADTAVGQNFSSSVTADVVDGASRTSQPTTYAVTTMAPSTSATNDETNVPARTYETAVKMIFDEAPSHGTDGKRVFVEGVGFILFSSTFDLAQSGGDEYRLQGIRDIDIADAGSDRCGSVP